MTTVNFYRVRCTTDNKDEYVWDTHEPTTCPTNAAHSIDSNLITIIHTIDQSVVEIKETGLSGGSYRLKGYCFDVDPGTNTINIGLPYNSTFMYGWFYATEEDVGDVLSLSVAPNTVIGTITANVLANTNVIPVSSTVFDNALVGHNVNLWNGVVSDDLGVIVNKNEAGGNITVETDTTQSWANTPLVSYVRLDVVVVDHLRLNSAGVYKIADKKVGGKLIPANYPVIITYESSSANTKQFLFTIEYIY